MDWLRFVTEGGSLVVLVVVLVWVFRGANDREKRMMDLFTSQNEHLKANTTALQQLCGTMDHHEDRSQERHSTREDQAKGRHREVMGKSVGAGSE